MRTSIHPAVQLLAGYAWRLVAIAAAVGLVLVLVGRLWVLFLPAVLTVLLARVLVPLVAPLRERGWHPTLAASAILIGFLAFLGLGVLGLGLAVTGELGDLGPTASDAVDDVERWLVEDSPFGLSEADLQEARDGARDAVRDTVRTSGGSLLSGAAVVVELVVSVVLGLIATFFALKDGGRFVAWIGSLLPPAHRPLAARLADRAWMTLGGYLRAAALLGLIEGTVIGVVLWAVGADLAVPVGLVTFLAAFVPFVGAVTAGALAVLVALATAGGPAALVTLAVAVLVQQLDNDLLAPVVYGRALRLHPLVVLGAIVGGGALFGLTGSILAVPVTAVTLNVVAEARSAAAGPEPSGVVRPEPAST